MKSLKRTAAALILALTGTTTRAGDDERAKLETVSAGDIIRFRHATTGKTIRAIVDDVREDLLLLHEDPAKEALRVSFREFGKLEVLRGKRSRWREGALIGFVPGALFMGVLVRVVDDCYRDCDRAGGIMGYGLAGGAVTGSVGALVGLAFHTDRWRTATARRRTDVAVNAAPVKGGFGASFSVRF